MNRVLLLLMVWFCACSPENTEIFDLSSSVDDIKLIKLRADHKMLLPDGTRSPTRITIPPISVGSTW